MKDTTFEQLGKDLVTIADNLVITMDTSIQKYSMRVGTQLITRTPKDSGQASINWIAMVGSESTLIKGKPQKDRDTEDFLHIFGSPMDAKEHRKWHNKDRNIAVANALREMVATISSFSASRSRFITFTNNLDYIQLLAYENHAKLPHTNPKAPPYTIVEENMENPDFWHWFEQSDIIFKGV